MSSHPRPLIRNLLQITSQKQGVKGRLLVATSQKQGGNEWLKNIRTPHFFSDPKNRQNQTGRGFAAFFTRKNRCDLFLIKQGKVVTRFAHSQNPKPKGKGGASNAP
ncbi:hypothetical protein DP578_23885 [Salmonella enterica]|nr:hypothetical protein [Salmonella enterica]ECT3431651.1 hypothetical protein [Salmonella enterica subsp. enterica serovar Braenderup]ECU4065223.1 hypothetical protein [Salmonella enterica subsp. enterica serovar Braenderup]